MSSLHSSSNNSESIIVSGPRLHDPLLEDLWAIKAQINAEGNYDCATIMARASAFAAPYFDETGHVKAISEIAKLKQLT